MAIDRIHDYIVPGKRAHLVGIGGVSMSPLAEVLQGEGLIISGSDMKESPAVEHLRSLGIPVTIGHLPENVAGKDLVIRTAAVHDSNPEIAGAVARGIPVYERAQAWGAIMQRYPNALCVAGTHGKTTTTSMCTHIFMAAEADPTVMIGGTLPLLGSGYRVGHGDTIILESCEYCNSFLSFFPTVAVILNVDADHLDFFKDLEDVKHSFRRFAELVPQEGCVVADGDDANTMDALRGLEGFSHIWLIWAFHQSQRPEWSPTVRPPRLGGNQRVGVFASRSPFRPNPLGLSSVRLEAIEHRPEVGPVLIVRGADLMDGTPIYDIKPYIPYADCRPEASGGFTGSGGRAVLDRLLAGEDCALVTDAGMPAISDPGEELVALCAAHGVTVTPIPGPCALVTALAASGQPTGRFTFEGFLAMNKKNRRRHLESLRGEERTMIFYEAPHKLAATLADLAEAFGRERPVSLCRELTKLHEEIRRTTLGEAADWYGEETPRGEFVLVVRGAQPEEEGECTLEDGLTLAERLREEEGLSLRDAVRQAAKELGLSRNELYRLAVEQE